MARRGQAGGSQKVAVNGSPTDGAKKVSAKNGSEPRTPAHIREELLPRLLWLEVVVAMGALA